VPEFYRRSKGFPFIDYLTAREATKVLEDARADVHAEVEGDLEGEDGFTYWAGWHESCGGLIRARVRPVSREHVPADELERLLAAQVAGDPLHG
jgi:hypothetical protein